MFYVHIEKKGEHVSLCLHAFETVPDYLYIGTIYFLMYILYIRFDIHEWFHNIYRYTFIWQKQQQQKNDEKSSIRTLKAYCRKDRKSQRVYTFIEKGNVFAFLPVYFFFIKFGHDFILAVA